MSSQKEITIKVNTEKFYQFINECGEHYDIEIVSESLSFIDEIVPVVNWKKVDLKEAVNVLVDSIRDKDFFISKDFVLKTFLYLYSKDIRFKIKNFSNDNTKDFEDKWEDIRDAILEVFRLVKSFGFTDYTLTSKDALIPVIYYIFHKNIHHNFSQKVEYQNDREAIKKWLHIMLIKRVFGSSADTILSQIRNAFTDDFETKKVKDDILEFPTSIINSKIKKDTSVSDEFIKELLCTQKDDKYAFSILSLLYPYLDYKNGNFFKEHLYPISIFTNDFINNLEINEMKKEEYYQSCVYNGIYNLQMLDANENMSKNDTNLNEWVKTMTKKCDINMFLDNHLIPNVDLSIDNFCDFIDSREKILITKLKTVLQ